MWWELEYLSLSVTTRPRACTDVPSSPIVIGRRVTICCSIARASSAASSQSSEVRFRLGFGPGFYDFACLIPMMYQLLPQEQLSKPHHLPRHQKLQRQSYHFERTIQPKREQRTSSVDEPKHSKEPTTAKPPFCLH